MKLTCDLCGGALQVNAGAQDASCKTCGLCYTMDMLRQKLGIGSVPQNKPVETPRSSAAFTPAVDPVREQPVIAKPQPTPVAAPTAKQFIMPVDKLFAACLAGDVKQGCIGIGETVYIDEDYSKPYRLIRFGNDPEATRVTAGQYTRLFIVPQNRGYNSKDAMRNARLVTGHPNPAINAYRCDGSVEGYFADILSKNFAEYRMDKQVEWPGLKIPVTFMLMKNNRPAIAVFVFDSHDAKSRYQAQKAQQIFENADIGCTHFYKDYRNDAPYVIDRIRAALGRLPY